MPRSAAASGFGRYSPIAASRLFAIDRERALRVGCAIEAIHVYSLIHDDLPCMDDAELRRGKPTVHKAFGEAEPPCSPATASTRWHSRSSLHPATHDDPWVRSDLVLELGTRRGTDTEWPAGR